MREAKAARARDARPSDSDVSRLKSGADPARLQWQIPRSRPLNTPVSVLECRTGLYTVTRSATLYFALEYTTRRKHQTPPHSAAYEYCAACVSRPETSRANSENRRERDGTLKHSISNLLLQLVEPDQSLRPRPVQQCRVANHLCNRGTCECTELCRHYFGLCLFCH